MEKTLSEQEAWIWCQGASQGVRCSNCHWLSQDTLCHCEARSNVARSTTSSFAPLLSVLCRQRHILKSMGRMLTFVDTKRGFPPLCAVCYSLRQHRTLANNHFFFFLPPPPAFFSFLGFGTAISISSSKRVSNALVSRKMCSASWTCFDICQLFVCTLSRERGDQRPNLLDTDPLIALCLELFGRLWPKGHL